jgi:ABC-type nitrate/sulfonate/bicarbonate transport system permease component
VAEWIGADRGLGYLIVAYAAQYQVEELWGAVIVTSCLSVIAFLIIVIIEWWSMPWQRGRGDNGIL